MKVSVCMATYNGERFIKMQVASILAQLNENDELIISDDSSTDQTLHILRGFNDNRIKLFISNNFRSPIYNFENAIKQSTGDVIMLSDQDDVWEPGKVDSIKLLLQQYDMVVNDCTIIDDSGRIIVESYFRNMNSRKGLSKNLFSNCYVGCCMSFKKTVLKKALPFPNDIPMHDIWLGFVAELFYKPFFLEKKLTLYRQHTNNVSSASKMKSPYTLSQKILFRWNLIKYIPKLIIR